MILWKHILNMSRGMGYSQKTTYLDSSLVYMGNNKIATSGNKGIEILDISTNPIAPIYTNTTLVDIVGILCALPHAHAAQIATEQLAVGTISGEVYILDERAQIVHTFFIDDLGDSEDIMCLLWIEGSSSSEVWVGDSFGHNRRKFHNYPHPGIVNRQHHMLRGSRKNK